LRIAATFELADEPRFDGAGEHVLCEAGMNEMDRTPVPLS